NRLVPGRTRQPGRVASRPALPAAPHARGSDPELRVAALVVVTRGRILGAARRAAKGAGYSRISRQDSTAGKAASDGEGLGDARRSPRAAAFRVSRRGDAARMAQEG